MAPVMVPEELIPARLPRSPGVSGPWICSRARKLGDLRGRKRVFLAAVAVFGASSMLCALARSPAELIAARAVQGLAAAGIAPQALATVQATFHGRERATVFGLFGIAGGLAQALGVTLGGVLTAANLGGRATARFRRVQRLHAHLHAVAARRQGYTPLRTGLVTLAFAAGSLPSALAVGSLTARHGRNLLAAGCALFAVGAVGVLAAAQVSHGTVPVWTLIPGLLACGAAINLIMPPLGILVLSAAPPRYAGTASGILSTTQQFGGALGIAALGTIFFIQAPARGYTAAFTASAAAVAAILAASAALSLTLPRNR
jgi:MFS family permease